MTGSNPDRYMEYGELYQNIVDMIVEQQLKLGESFSGLQLYYPLSSLNRFLKTDLSGKEMLSALEGFSDYARETLGEITADTAGSMFRFMLSEEAQMYARSVKDRYPFLKELVDKVSRHGAGMEEVLDIFRKYSDQVRIERKTGEDFDALAYFSDGIPDRYRYCLTDEGGHVIYHRFTEADYLDFYPEG